MTKYILFSLLIGLTFLLPSCEDHFETGVEGSWQMTHITQADGTEVRVDTVFYRLKKKVFQYYHVPRGAWFGMYEEKGDSLFITIKENVSSFNAWDGEASRHFKIEKLKSNKMVLKHKDETYHFRIF